MAAKQSSTVNLKIANYTIIHIHHTIDLYILYVNFFVNCWYRLSLLGSCIILTFLEILKCLEKWHMLLILLLHYQKAGFWSNIESCLSYWCATYPPQTQLLRIKLFINLQCLRFRPGQRLHGLLWLHLSHKFVIKLWTLVAIILNIRWDMIYFWSSG